MKDIRKYTVPLHMDDVWTIFPSFNIEKIDNDDARSYFTFEGQIYSFCFLSF